MYKLRVTEMVAASHQLHDHRGACANLHGHTWSITVTVESKDLHGGGMVMDFGDIKFEFRRIIERYDHAHLNDLVEFATVPPTCECFAVVLLRKLQAVIPGVTAVCVAESPTTSVEVTA